MEQTNCILAMPIPFAVYICVANNYITITLSNHIMLWNRVCIGCWENVYEILLRGFSMKCLEHLDFCCFAFCRIEQANSNYIDGTRKWYVCQFKLL